MLTRSDQHRAESPAAEARASKTTGGKYGRVPTSLVAPTAWSPMGSTGLFARSAPGSR
jgi:hypothetical protein